MAPDVCAKCGKPHKGCRAHNRAGEPCGLAPMPGGLVCRAHGGANPVVKAKAQLRATEQRVRATLGDREIEPVFDVIGTYLANLGEMLLLRDALRDRVNELQRWAFTTYGPSGNLAGEQAGAELELYARTLANVDAGLARAIKLGLDEARLRERAKQKVQPEAAALLEFAGRLLDVLDVPAADRPGIIQQALGAA